MARPFKFIQVLYSLKSDVKRLLSYVHYQVQED